MPINDVVAAVIFAEHCTSKHLKPPPAPAMTNSSKSEVILHGSGGDAAAVTHLNNAPAGIGLSGMQGQKWQQVFDLDKVIKQLRAAEKTYLRGGKGNNVGSSESHTKHVGHCTSGVGTGSGGSAVVQVQRLNAQDMPYYDIVPKQTKRDIVVCNACNGSYTKVGFNNHVALQHPNIWDAMSNKVCLPTTSDAYRTGTSATPLENRLDCGRETGCAVESLDSPTETISGTMSTCSNGSSSSASQQSSYGVGTVAAVVATNNIHSASASSTSSSSSSRHKSSKSSSSSSKAGSSSGSSNSRSRSKSSKNRHHSSPPSSLEPTMHQSGQKSGNGGSNSVTQKRQKCNVLGSSQVIVTPQTIPTSVRDEVPITVYSSSSNSSCSLPATPKTELGSLAASNNEVNVAYSPAKQSVTLMDAKDTTKHDSLPAQPKKKIKGSLDVVTDNKTHCRTYTSKLGKDKQMPPQYEQQINELDKAVSSITDGNSVIDNGDRLKSLSEATPTYVRTQHQVDLSAVTDEPMPVQNTSDDNSISLTLDDMLDSKFINEILNTAEADIPFDESALDTSQQQPLASKRIRYDDATIPSETGDFETETALYQQQHHQYEDINNTDTGGNEQTQLTAIDAMQLQQLIFQQQQMLEQSEQKHTQQMDVEQYANAGGNGAAQQFNVYTVPSLTDDVDEAVATNHATTAAQLGEHMILPSIIYEITDNNQVSVLDQQSQQQVIAEFLTQAGYDNVDVNVLQATDAATESSDAVAGGVSGGAAPANFGFGTHLINDELYDMDFTKLETVRAEATNTKTVKLELSQSQLLQQNQQSAYNSYESDYTPQPHRQLINAKFQEDTYFNVLLYAGTPRPLAMNTFGLVKLPNGLGTALRKRSLLTTRKANNSLLSLNGCSGVVGNLTRFPQTAASGTKQGFSGHSNNEFSIGPITTNNISGNSGNNNGPAQQRNTITSMPNGKTIYAQSSSVIVQDRLKCNRRTLLSKLDCERLGSNMTAKRLNDLLLGKIKLDREKVNNEEPSEQQQHTDDKTVARKRIRSFYEKRRRLLSNSQKNYDVMRRHQQLMRQHSLHVPLPLQLQSKSQHKPEQELLLKKQLLRTLSDCGSNSNIIASGSTNSNSWKSNSSTPSSNSGGGDLMRVFV
ncbi:uncharacterized protein LOC115628468 [Scaptodrosophila lebanonensis]|uniref:Uncharacterized protein LOC115628468 n=1 Tax=Drosophila lebanonensis TaxID=7225 RepID=A0A6J2TXY8_DROLE|nr:uncharacterized protein LOC115628468 [Scaptodrosophila lebanonensis]